MASQGEMLAERYEQANNDFIQTIQTATPAQWSQTVSDTGWPAGVTAHHLASSAGALTDLMRAVAAGNSPSLSLEQINEGNAQHAKDAANCTKDETVALARSSGQEAEATLRSLTDQQLGNTLTLGTNKVTLQQLIDMIVLGHFAAHLPGIRTALKA